MFGCFLHYLRVVCIGRFCLLRARVVHGEYEVDRVRFSLSTIKSEDDSEFEITGL
ncbi:hypothetical protein M758_4G100400 [Ceratodon purpureus]|nr:hypothetical protein M758_4G100400 [Ceratodon purpureus]